MNFKYKKYGSGVYRPVIPITLSFKNKNISYEVLVDSGADMCIFDAQIGEIIGVPIQKGIKHAVSGITGQEEFYFVHPITVSVGNYKYETLVGFLPNIADLGYGVVGQQGFFDNFTVKFDYKNEDIELIPKR